MFFNAHKYIYNALAHYTISNRLEYIKIIIRIKEPKSVTVTSTTDADIENTYIISLDKEHTRRKLILESLIREKQRFEFIRAIKGRPVFYDGIPINRRSYHYLTQGSIGCWLSHYKVWARALAENHEHILILEDDVILESNFYHQLNKELRNTPKDYDILYLGSGNNYKRNRRVIINKTLFIPYQIRNGNYAYIISKSGLSKLTDQVPQIQVTRGGIDSAIGALIRNKKLNAYHLINNLCYVNFSFESATKQ